jgi:hypothetical protein
LVSQHVFVGGLGAFDALVDRVESSSRSSDFDVERTPKGCAERPLAHP